jgi:hypothetical protein
VYEIELNPLVLQKHFHTLHSSIVVFNCQTREEVV